MEQTFNTFGAPGFQAGVSTSFSRSKGLLSVPIFKMTAIPASIQIQAWFTGKVQGVYFRKTTQTMARQLGLTGWVKNLSDGRVEMVAVGPPEKVEALLFQLHLKFMIEQVEQREYPDAASFSEFEVRW